MQNFLPFQIHIENISIEFPIMLCRELWSIICCDPFWTSQNLIEN